MATNHLSSLLSEQDSRLKSCIWTGSLVRKVWNCIQTTYRFLCDTQKCFLVVSKYSLILLGELTVTGVKIVQDIATRCVGKLEWF
jgi:hypothetical protein